MATTGVGFRWLDILEKEFDKACVELDTSITEWETEDPEVVFTARQKIATLSSCFAQLTHKALTIFQNSAKLEAELVDMRAELVQARAAGGCAKIGEVACVVPEATRARVEANQLTRENAALRETVLALHSELYGARLATKYLDKELAGRIQQLQLLGRDMRSELRDSLWAQVEAEILLQRHKTLVRVCRGLSPRPPRPPPATRARPRTVCVRRSPHLGLGISVTGGREHGVPILISELEAGGPAALTGQLYVGDAILAINDCDLTQACHKEAVAALQSVKGDCALCVQFIATDDDDRMSEDNYRFPLYPEDGSAYGDEADGSGATPTAPRTPDLTHRASVCEGYADYSTVRNNLAILDMDDDSIKIEARLEMAPVSVSACAASARGSYSSATPESTPVHARNVVKKKRKPQDWRTKGAYCAVSPDAHSSDEPPDTTLDMSQNTSQNMSQNMSQIMSQKMLQNMSQNMLTNMSSDAPSSDEPADTRDESHNILTNMSPDVTRHTSHENHICSNHLDNANDALGNSIDALARSGPISVAKVTDMPVAVLIPSDAPPASDTQPAPAANAPTPAPTQAPKPAMLNGDSRLRRETKGFRIGSARRVTEMGARNGDVSCGASASLPHPASRLLPGHGDPDFGTPV